MPGSRMIASLRKRMTPAGQLTRPQWLPNPSKYSSTGSSGSIRKSSGLNQVAFARRMDMEHVDYRGGSRETRRNIVADSDKHMINGRGVISKRPTLGSTKTFRMPSSLERVISAN